MAVLAFIIDLILGDPRWFPHPVRGMGWLNDKFEGLYRKIIANEIYAGTCAAISILFTCGAISFVILYSATLVNVNIYIITCT